MAYFRGLVAVWLLLLMVGCSALTTAEQTVCTDISALPASVTATLGAADPHSALGVLWADAKSGCANGVPAAGVGVSWTGEVWGMLKALAPTVIPWLIGLL